MKHLKIEVKTVEGWGKFLRVVEQTHRGNAFGERWNTFTCNGFTLKSLGHIDVSIDLNCLYVLGEDEKLDKLCVVVPSEEWLKGCKEAIRAYNNHFSEKKNEEGKKNKEDVEVIE
ncbi:hypothetical protein DRN73_08215 [Candidatus Pacearchaeota archaeon]|nr:MAG: hypothetical protein DRN73_08215 [Candidatus Pacearchaeota archaeon]